MAHRPPASATGGPAAGAADAEAGSTVILIPARLGSTRLPNKPLAMIAGEPMIVHAWRRAIETGLGPVIVAVDDDRIGEAVVRAGGQAVSTRPDHPSGTDRIAEALALVDPQRRYRRVINLQGDLPTVAPAIARRTAALLEDAAVELATAVALITRPGEAEAESVVKMIGSPLGPGRFRALYFTRVAAPWGPGPLYHHVGLYAWQREAFERFVALPPSVLEQRERLEQLRALEAGMRVDAVLVDDVPLGVDTPADLERVRHAMAPLVPPPAAGA